MDYPRQGKRRRHDRFPPPKPGDPKGRGPGDGGPGRPGGGPGGPGGPGGSGSPGGRSPWSGASRSLMIWTLIVLAAVVGWSLLNSKASREALITPSEFQQFIDQGLVNELVVVGGTEVHGKLRSPVTRDQGGVTRTYDAFHVTLLEGLIDNEVLQQWSD